MKSFNLIFSNSRGMAKVIFLKYRNNEKFIYQ